MSRLILPGSEPLISSPVDIDALADNLTTAQINISNLLTFEAGFNDWTDFTPVLTATTTNPTLGTGSVQSGRYMYLEPVNLVIYVFFIQFGSSGVNAGSGLYRVSMPVTPASHYTIQDKSIGQVLAFDWSVAGNRTLMEASVKSTNLIQLNATNGVVSNSFPQTWAADDRFGGTVVYEGA